MKYWAFLSYSHTDAKWGDWLHGALETYRVPRRLVGRESRDGKVPERLFPIFRDREELPVSSDLSTNINEALEQSRYLIVICSPRSAKSRWVGEEIRTFKRLGREDRILALIVDGEPNASDEKLGSALKDECFHEALRYRIVGREQTDIRTEPVAADVREGKDGRTNAKLKLVSGLLGISYDELKQRDRRRHRRRIQKLVVSAVLAAAVLAALSIALFVKRQDALRAVREGEHQRLLAQQESERRQRLLAETARSDLMTAREDLQRGELPAAFAYLARSLLFNGTSIEAAGEAVSALNIWKFSTPIAVCSHEDQVTAAEFSPDGRYLATASNDKTACIWESETGKLIALLKGHEGALTSVHWSPDGERVVTSSTDDSVRLWNARNGESLAVFKENSGVRTAIFSPSGQQIVTLSDDRTVEIWDLQTGKAIASFSAHHNGIFDLQLSADGQRILTASDDRTARVWNAATGKPLLTLEGHQGAVIAAQFSPDSKLIATVSWDNTARLWDAETGKILAVLAGHQEHVRAVQFSPNSELLATGSDDDTARIWDVKTHQLLLTLTGHRGDVGSVRFSLDGQRLVTGSSDGTARVWNVASGTLVTTLQGHRGIVLSARFSPDGRHVLTAADQVARVWSAKSGKLIVTLMKLKKLITHVSFSSNGQRFVTKVSGGPISVWEIQHSGPVATLQTDKESLLDISGCIQLSPDGQFVAIGGEQGTSYHMTNGKFVTTSNEGMASIWNANTGELLKKFDAHSVKNINFSPTNDRIVTASSDQTAKVWDMKTGKLLATFNHPSAVLGAQFSPDGKRIATAAADQIVRVWDVNAVKLIVTCEGHHAEVNGVQFSPNGDRLVSSAGDGTARVWEASNGKLLATLPEQGKGGSAQFCSDGEAVTTIKNATATVWEIPTGKILASLRPDPEQFPRAPFDPTLNQVYARTDKGKTVFTGDTWRIMAAQFAPDCQSLITASVVGAVSKWTIVPPNADPPPAWFVDFLHYMVQVRLNAAGELESVPAKEWSAIRDRLRQTLRENAGNDTPYLRILRHFAPE